jgi:hypothetical protein
MATIEEIPIVAEEIEKKGRGNLTKDARYSRY